MLKMQTEEPTTPDRAQQLEALLERLLQGNFVESSDLQRLRHAVSQSNASLCGQLVELGLVPERTLLTILSDLTGLASITAERFPSEPVLEGSVSVSYLRKANVLPLAADEHAVTLAVGDPFDDFVERSFALLTGKKIHRYLAVPSEIEEAVQRLYNAGRSSLDEIVGDIQDDRGEDEIETQRLADMACEAPVVRLVGLLIARSVEAGASDIHFETYENKLQIRYRIDGVLQDLEAPPQHAAAAITSRIKIMAKLNIAERRLPQDGRIRLAVRGKTIDFRVSIVPTLHGERIVLRVLDRDTTPKSLRDLGLSDNILQDLTQILQKPNGMFLVTGPTGSGKTTTLYAALLSLPSKQKNILTVEDPIEYQIANISQMQVKPQIGLTFANILRSVLRQDPDIILVGEIRDQETADIAVHAALTGHLVLSTLHTNTAAGAIARLMDMGVQDYLLTTSIEGVMAQRLVRCLCPSCKLAHIVPVDLVPGLRQVRGIEASGRVEIYKPAGCKKCNGTGYRGRTAIAEILMPNERIRQLIMRHASTQEIHAAAVEAGMKTMLEDGLAKVITGITSLEEVKQVVTEIV